MITSALKDRILTELVNLGISLQTDIHKDSKDYEINTATYCVILDQFEQLGYIKQQKCLGGVIFINVTANAHDFVRLGGFVGQEELLKGNIQKLGLEIDLLCKELSPNLLEKAQKITAIGQSILSVISLMK